MNEQRVAPPPSPTPPTSSAGDANRDGLPAYEPPRVVKKRSVARATLATGTGPVMGGLMAQG
jgi:hypothetical protein